MMRIVLDGSVVYGEQGAAYKYFVGILGHLRQQSEWPIEVIPSVTGVLDELAGRPQRRAGERGVWGRVRRRAGALFWRWRARASGPAIFHSYYYTRSPVKRWPELQLVHDLITEKFESEHQSPQDHLFRRRKRDCLRAAAHLIAVSQNTKRDLCEVFGISPERVAVVPQGLDAAYFATDVPAVSRRLTLAHYGIDRPYFLQVGGRMRHKNFGRALQAYAESGLYKELLLVCAGEWISAEEEALIRKFGLKDAIRHAHWPAEHHLRNLYREAKGLVYPSLYEGFGIPPLEAMASGIPVAASHAASLPEVCGEAAAYFDPIDPSAIARAMASLLEPATARALVTKGKARAAQFSWQRVAAETVAVYRKMVGPRSATRAA